MHLERVTLTNFQCFGPAPHTIMFDQQLTALLGVNGSGKTAAIHALLRLFSVVADQRQVRVEDFHVPHDETEAPAVRTLRVDAVFAFPNSTPTPPTTPRPPCRSSSRRWPPTLKATSS